MTTIDILIIFAYIAYALFTGFRTKAESTKDLNEYFLAGRSLKGWQAGISMAATQFAADTPLLVTGLIATAGIFSLWRLWIYAIAFLMLGFLLAASWRKANVITDAELTEVRYGKKPALVLRGFKAFYLGTVFNCTVLAMVLLAATRIAEPFLLWNEWLPAGVFEPVVAFVQWIGTPLTITQGEDVWVRSASNLISIIAITAVTTFYSTTGGLRNVIKMDIFQFGLMMVSTAIYAGFVVAAVGGLSAIPEQIHTLFADGGPGHIFPNQILAFTPTEAKDVTMMLLMVFAVQWVAQINSDGTGYLAQRAMACKSDNDAKQATVVFAVAQILLRSLFWLPIGLGLLILFPPDPVLTAELFKAEREATYVQGIVELLPPGAMGLIITGMLAALGSTVDTHLNWGSSYWTNDIYQRIICKGLLKRTPSGRSLVWVARISNILILLLSLVIMTQLSSIQVAWQTSLLLGAGLGVMLVLRWLWWRVNAWGEIATIIVSLILAPILISVIPIEHDALRMLILAGVATVIGIVVSLVTGPEDMGQLQAFYEKAQPPGFWKPVAESLGHSGDEPLIRFQRGVLATFAASFALFCLLTGLGSWISGSPVPVWFPMQDSLAWVGTNVLVGSFLLPVSLMLGFKAPDVKEEAPSMAADPV